MERRREWDCCAVTARLRSVPSKLAQRVSPKISFNEAIHSTVCCHVIVADADLTGVRWVQKVNQLLFNSAESIKEKSNLASRQFDKLDVSYSPSLNVNAGEWTFSVPGSFLGDWVCFFVFF